MVIIETGLLAFLAFLAVILILHFLPDGNDAPVRRFTQECRRSGMTFEDTQAAISTRVAFVRLRREASDRCVARDGDISREHINEIAGNIAIGLAAAHGQDTAKSFIGWVDSCPDEEILYDDARMARHDWYVRKLRNAGKWPPRKNAKLSSDFATAFKIVG